MERLRVCLAEAEPLIPKSSSTGYEYPFRCESGPGFSILEKPQLVFGDKTILQTGMVIAVDGYVSVKKLSWRSWETVLSSRKTAMSR